eukprot:s138_g15.t1
MLQYWRWPALCIFDASLAQVQTEQTLGLREVMFGIYCRRVFDVDVLQKTWTGAGDGFGQSWLSDIVLWSTATDMEQERQAPAVALVIVGAARDLIREIPPQQLRDGMGENGDLSTRRLGDHYQLERSRGNPGDSGGPRRDTAGHGRSEDSEGDLGKIIWLPDIGVTNRDFKNLEVISSSVKVWKDGRATKVERVLATMTSDFDTKAYPFDQQKLKVILASEKLMADELVLNPHTDQKVTGVARPQWWW